MFPDELRRREQVLVGGQCAGPAAGAGRGLGQHRPARLPGQLDQGQRVVVAVAADHHAAFGPWQLERAARGVLVRERGPRLPAGTPVERLRPLLAAAGYQRLAEGQVEVHRARQAADRARRVRPGLTGQRAPVTDRARPGLGQAALAEPAHRGAVQLDLVDGLVGADPPQLRGPVGGEHDERHAGLVGFDHRGMEVGRCRARGAQHRHRAAAGLGQAERGERGGALVDPDMQPRPLLARGLVERHRQRRAARPGRQHYLAQPTSDQLVAEGGAERGGGVHDRYPAAAAARSRHGPGSVSQRASSSGSTAGRRTGSDPASGASGLAVTSPASSDMVPRPQA